MERSNCPSESDLLALRVGSASEELASGVIEHLSTCAACQAAFDTLDESPDSFVRQMRQGIPDAAFLDEPRCWEAIGRAKSLATPSLETDYQGRAQATEIESLGALGEYQLLERIGRGGMGTVYKALHTNLQRLVALKAISEDLTRKPEAISRFYREMQAIGRLDHPNIVQAHDAREIEGRAVLVMEFVEGASLADLVRDGKKLDVADACELVRQAAVGVDYAHQRGLVHRDIKPSNLMLNTRGEVKILDLGLALLQEVQTQASGELTASGQVMGTPDYMAPEQCDDSHRVDHRADIYSLGATLYKLLAGEAPFGGEKYNTPAKKLVALTTETPTPIQDRRDDVPPELAEALHRMLARDPDGRYADPAAVANALTPFAADAELDELLSRSQDSLCPEREMSASVSTSGDASAAAEDTNPSDPSCEAVVPAVDSVSPGIEKPSFDAKPSPAVVRRRYSSRPVVAIGFVGLAALVLFGIVMSITGKYGTLTVETDDPNIQVAVKQGGEVVEIADQRHGWAIRLKEGKYELEVQGGEDQFELDRDTITVRGRDKVRVKVTGVQPGRHDRSVVAATLAKAPTIEELDRAYADGGRLMEVARWAMAWGEFAPDGEHLILANRDGETQVTNMFTHEVVQTLQNVNRPIAFSPDGNHMAAFADNGVQVWDWRKGQVVEAYEGDVVGMRRLAFTVNGRLLAALVKPGAVARAICVWDVGNGQPMWLEGHTADVEDVLFTVDRRQLLSVAQKEIRLWDLDTGTPRIVGTSNCDYETHLSVSPDGSTFLCSGWLSEVQKWDVDGGEPTTFPHKLGRVWFSPDGSLCVGGGGNNLTRCPLIFSASDGRVWNDTPLPLEQPCGFANYLDDPSDMVFSPNGDHLLGIRGGRSVHLYRLPTCTDRFPLVVPRGNSQPDLPNDEGTVGQVWASASALRGSFCLTPDARFVVCAGKHPSWGPHGDIRLLDVMTGRTLRRISHPMPASEPTWFSAGGHFAAIQDYADKKVYLYDLETGELKWKTDDYCRPFALSPGGTFFLCTHPNGRKLVLFDTATLRPLCELWANGTKSAYPKLRLSRDGRFVAMSSRDLVDVWSLPTNMSEREKLGASTPLAPICALKLDCRDTDDMAFSPDGLRLATTYAPDEKICIWNLADGSLEREIDGLASGVVSLDWADGGRLIGGTLDETVRLWDAETGEATFPLHGHTAPVSKVRFLPDCNLAISGHCPYWDGNESDDPTVRLWRVPPPGTTQEKVDYTGEVERVTWMSNGPETQLVDHQLLLDSQLAVTIAYRDERDKEDERRTICLWDIDTGELLRELEGHDGTLTQLGATRDGRIITACGTSGKVWIWNSETGEILQELDAFPPGRLSCSGRWLLTRSADAIHELWDLQTQEQTVINLGNEAPRWPSKGTLCWLPDERHLLWAPLSHPYLATVDVESGKMLAELERSIAPNYSIICSPSPQNLALIGEEHGKASLWDLHSGRERQPLRGRFGRAHEHGRVYAGSFSPDGNWVLTSGEDTQIRIWETATGQLVHSFGGHAAAVVRSGFSPDGKHVLSISLDGTIRKWRLPNCIAAEPAK